MKLSNFQGDIKEHYVKPMDEFYRDRYRKTFKEEPPEDSRLMMDRMIKHGEEQCSVITIENPCTCGNPGGTGEWCTC